LNRIEEIIKERPHLESPLSFYKKVREYAAKCEKEIDIFGKEETFPRVIKTLCDLFGLPKESLHFLIDELSEKGIDPFSSPSSIYRLPFYHDELKEDEKKRLLFLLSKPFFLRLKKDKVISFAEDGRCPVCGEIPSISRITEDNHRKLLCSFCEHEADFHRIGCPFCLIKEGEKIDILLDEEDIRVELCNNCKSYIKSMREEHISKYEDPFLVDIVSLPLDVIAQKRGYIRRSPNLIGVLDIK